MTWSIRLISASIAVTFYSPLALAGVCYTELTSKPFCISRANATSFCETINNDTSSLAAAKKCLKDFKNQGFPASQSTMLCLMGYVKTGDPKQDTSNCENAKSEAPKAEENDHLPDTEELTEVPAT